MFVKFSFIVPVYNCAAYLEACVTSMLAQTLQDFEILLIDDGATDQSGKLCDELAARDSRIQVYHKPNGGAADARNYGLDRANGSFVLFVDADDTISPNCLETVEPVAAAGTMAIYGMSFAFYRKDHVIRTKPYSCNYSGTYSPREVTADFAGFFEDNQLSSACNKLFDRNLIEQYKIRFSKGMTVYEDFDFVIRYLCHASSVSCLPIPLYRYRVSEKGGNLDRRITEIERLRSNMNRLAESLLTLYERFSEPQVISVSANLYLQMLDQHLLYRKSLKTKQLRAELPLYCAGEAFVRTVDRGAQLHNAEKNLLHEIQIGSFGAVARAYRNRRLMIRVKRLIKRIVNN